jgi:hypothetical protein
MGADLLIVRDIQQAGKAVGLGSPGESVLVEARLRKHSSIACCSGEYERRRRGETRKIPTNGRHGDPLTQPARITNRVQERD